MSNMITSYTLLILVVTCTDGAANIASFPEALYPSEILRTTFRSQCPLQSRKIDFCASRYQDCFGHSRTVGYCRQQFCECLKVNNDPNENSCKRYSDEACLTVHKHGNAFQKGILEKREKLAADAITKRIKPIIEPYNKLVEDCGVASKLKLEEEKMRSQLNSTNAAIDLAMPFLAMFNVESSLSKTKECIERIDKFGEALETADKKASENLQHPYYLWYTGIEFGSIGKVFTRIGTDEMCGKASFELNQGSASRLDCYDQQDIKEDCDKKYIEHIYYVLSTMDSKKLDCKMIVDLMKVIQDLRSEDFYKEAREFYSDASTTSIRGKFNIAFDGFENSSMTRRETKTTFLDLDASQKSTLRIKEHFESVSSKCGAKNSADTVASCGLRYEYCVHFNEKECQKQLSICLDSIEDKTDECQKEIARIVNLLWPNAKSNEYGQDNSFEVRHILYIGLGMMFLAVVACAAVHYRAAIKHKVCGRRTQNDVAGIEMALRQSGAPLQQIGPQLPQEGEAIPLLEPPVESKPAIVSSNNNNSNDHEIDEDIRNNETQDPGSMKYDEDIPIDLSQPSTSFS